jgi:hypothetical protein
VNPSVIAELFAAEGGLSAFDIGNFREKCATTRKNAALVNFLPEKCKRHHQPLRWQKVVHHSCRIDPRMCASTQTAIQARLTIDVRPCLHPSRITRSFVNGHAVTGK